MNAADLSGDDPAFTDKFSDVGAAKLKNLVDAKLKIVAGDFYNETLADYVMVLVRNGRCKSEVLKLLDVFIGEETNSFVSWLWDQLSYIGHKISSCDNSTETNSQMTKKVKEHSSQLQRRSCKKMNSDVVYEKHELNINRRQHVRKYYSQRSKNEDYIEDINSRRAKLIGRSHHPLRIHHKRKWLDEVESGKNKVQSFQPIAPTSRLLQFALRDLITNQQRTTSGTESSLKRPHKKAKNDDTEDVDSVFLDRLNHDDTPETNDHPSIYEADLFDEEELNDIFEIAKDINFNTLDDTGDKIRSTHGENEIEVRSQEQNTAIESNSSQKILNISVNVSTWKPPHVGKSKNLVDIQGDNRRAKRKVQLNNSAIFEDHLAASAEVTKKLKKTIPSTPGLCSETCTSDDADTRTIFISNVHFATTKEILSSHFSEFGDIRKSIILSDATTGQPTGSAVIEFSKEESAEQALSFNGTYFLSRVIKVVKGKLGPAHDNTKPIVRRRISRYSLSGPIFQRVVPFSRGGSSGYLHQRAPLSVKAHSLQWNREENIKPVQMASAPKRNFTYVRKIY